MMLGTLTMTCGDCGKVVDCEANVMNTTTGLSVEYRTPIGWQGGIDDERKCLVLLCDKCNPKVMKVVRFGGYY